MAMRKCICTGRANLLGISFDTNMPGI